MNLKIENIDDKRLFIDGLLKEEEKTWLDPDGDVKIATATIDLIDKNTAYLNRADALRAGKGYGQEILSSMIQLLKDKGFHNFKGYIESENVSSQNMLRKLGFKKTTETKDGAYWEKQLD